MKRTAALLALALTVACSSTPMQSSSAGSGGATLASSSKDAPEYILLTSPGQIRDVDHSTRISSLHIKGTLTNRGFYPAGQVEGNGEFCADGKDFLSLADLSVHTASEGKTPKAPYLLGCATKSGFKPASRDVVMQ
ncbi:MAG TPA: hypothetical protein VJ276_18710 [Thermoanaerobaculia bacterium]|nr:hypothetical protein [Thermoanaerobaculia bacterium]